MADIFGDDSLFSEFERDRDNQNIFIQYDQDESGTENRSRIIFAGAESDSDTTDNEEGNEKEIIPDATTAGSTTSASDEQTKPSSDAPADAEGEQSSAAQSTSYQEQFQKNKLRQFARIIDSTRYVSDEQSPAIQIVFQNNKFAKRYRSRIEQFIISLAQHADKKDFTKTATDLSCKATSVSTCVDINDKLPVEKHNNRMWQAHGIIGCAQFHNGFMVDSRGWPHEMDEPKEFGSAEVPKYFQPFDEIYPPDETIAKPSKSAKPKEMCFNCGGDHRLNECVAPKDHNRIRAKRRERMENKSSNPGRYHLDPELDPKKKTFVAGTISDDLRQAMGLKADQLPSYIYRMRMFGYPPGWLLEANRKASSLAMYDKDGHETNLKGESLEDGECGEQPAAAETFDLNKIIEYPGFTVPVPPGFNDESESIGMPPIQQHQLKKTLMDDMVAKETAKKRQLEEEVEEESRKKLKTGAEDMDIAEDDEKSPVPKETSTPAEGDKKGEEEKDRDSPSMDSLQQEYKNLMQQLDSEADSQLANGSTSDASAAPASSEAGSSTSADKSMSESQLFREKNFSFSSCNSVSKDFGTPILVREKSIKALPSAEKFSQGVEDHIPFENLPDSVGTFEKMRNLFSLIRNKVRKTKK